MALTNAERQRRYRQSNCQPAKVIIRESPTCLRCGLDLSGKQIKYCSFRCSKLYLGAAAKRRQRLANDPFAEIRAELEIERQSDIAKRLAEKENVTL